MQCLKHASDLIARPRKNRFAKLFDTTPSDIKRTRLYELVPYRIRIPPSPAGETEIRALPPRWRLANLQSKRPQELRPPERSKHQFP